MGKYQFIEQTIEKENKAVKDTYSNYFKTHPNDDNLKPISNIVRNIHLDMFINSRFRDYFKVWGVDDIYELCRKITEWKGRPTREQLDSKQAELNMIKEKEKESYRNYINAIVERDKRPNISLEQYEELLTNKNLPIDWNTKHSHLSDLEKQNKEINAFLTSQGVSDLIQLDTNIQNITNERNQFGQERDTCRSDKEIKVSQIKTLSEEKSNLILKLNNLTNENKDLSQQIKELGEQEKKNTRLKNEEIKKIQSKITKIEKEIQADLDSKNKELKKLQDEIKQLEKEKSEDKKAIQKLEEERKRDLKTLDDQSETIKSQKNELENQRNKSKSLEQEKQRLSGKLNEYVELMKEYLKETKKLRSKYEKLIASSHSSTKSKDYYDILGISRDNTWEEIKKVYKGLSLTYHPDKHNNSKWAEDKFKEIVGAYEKLEKIKKEEIHEKPKKTQPTSSQEKHTSEDSGGWCDERGQRQNEFSVYGSKTIEWWLEFKIRSPILISDLLPNVPSVDRFFSYLEKNKEKYDKEYTIDELKEIFEEIKDKINQETDE
ncbi:MAG: Chaperone protein DnaJ [Mycoplasmataceae bacterium]|nr:MAG: Chaperone protein DnaJ [Mycoplasmataceae bacterium]